MSTTIENNVLMARGTWFVFKRRWWWNERGYDLYLLKRVMVGVMLCHWNFWVSGRSSFPNFSFRLPWEGFFEKDFLEGSLWEYQIWGWQRCGNLTKPRFH
jgi:hypothetical protein